MSPKAKKQKIVRTTTAVSTVTVQQPPVSALAARRLQLQEAANKASALGDTYKAGVSHKASILEDVPSNSTSKPSTPESEEHVEVDNVDIDNDEEASKVSLNTDSDDDGGNSSDQGYDVGIKPKSTIKDAGNLPLYERRERKLFLDPQSISSFKPTPDNVAYSSTKGNSDIIVVGLKQGETIVFQGCINIIPLSGYASVLGYILSGPGGTRKNPSEITQSQSALNASNLSSISRFTVISPRTHALAVVESISAGSVKREQLVPQKVEQASFELQEQLKALTTHVVFDDFDTVLAIQSGVSSGIFGIEKVVPLFKGILSAKHLPRPREMGDPDKLAQTRFETSMNGFHPIQEPTDSISAMKIPPTWHEAIQTLIEATVDENGEFISRPPVSVVCGGKKMGKSTLSRLLLNRMLNRYKKVAFIECDIGQSEFTPVGMVALHIIETPALGAPFTHPRQPYRAFFVGNSTPRDDPEYYMACIKELIKTYYSEVTHTQTWMDADDIDYNSSVEDEHIPLIINTQGWIKGMGYNLLLELLDYTVPSHIFGFHSPSYSESNLPQSFSSTLKSRALEIRHPCPTIFYVEAVALGDENNISPFTKYHPADHRALALLSYFYLKQGPDSGLNSSSGDRLIWDFTQALVVRRPWCWDWSNAKGVWVLFDQVPPSQILHVLNASLVALIGDKEEAKSKKCDSSKTVDGQHPHLTNDDLARQINYFPIGQYPPPPPEYTTCHGLAIIRSIQPSTRTFHILTPIPLSKLKKCNGVVKGVIHMPLHASLDHTVDSSTVPGVAGVPWKKVPYLHYETPLVNYEVHTASTGQSSPRLGLISPPKIIGSDAKVTRKNLGRKRLL
ncbi:hypothetical protein BCR41DRAFT_389064, partial [Lobosporangium transversale]